MPPPLSTPRHAAAGLHELGARVSEVKERLQARIAQLMQKQNEMLRAQVGAAGWLAGAGLPLLIVLALSCLFPARSSCSS